MQVVDAVYGDVQRRALDVARRDAGTGQVDHHLALRGHGRSDELRLTRGVLNGGRTKHAEKNLLFVEGQAVGGTGCHIVCRIDDHRNTCHHAVLLEGIIGGKPLAVYRCGVERVVHIVQQTALRERCLPDAHLVDVGSVSLA